MKELVLFDFKEPQSVRDWIGINDGVMGGMSTGAMCQAGPEHSRFTGVVSFENNGGFASVRSNPLSVSLKDFDGVSVSFCGDGKTYKIRFKPKTGPNGFCYEIPFTTNSGRWEERRFIFRDAKPKLRGYKIPFVPRLKGKDIESLGFLISDRQEGAFQLDIRWIKACAEGVL